MFGADDGIDANRRTTVIPMSPAIPDVPFAWNDAGDISLGEVIGTVLYTAIGVPSDQALCSKRVARSQ